MDRSLFLLLLIFGLNSISSAQDMPLSQVLIEGEDWEVVSQGHAFTDGLCADNEGNVYFSDVKGGDAIYQVDLEGNTSKFITGAPGISGLQWGPDGKVYACVARGKKVVVYTPSGEETILAEDVRPNDLVVTHSGNLYFTMTPTKEIRRIDPEGNMTIVNAGTITKPNGITLSPDQETLVVSDYGGTNVWAFKINQDGTLSDPSPYMTMRAPVATPEVAKGDGSATDIHGRYYVTTAEGLQMFDPTGRMGGVISKPQDANLVSACFAGPGHQYLHIANGDKIYRRKTKTSGALFFQAPRNNEKYQSKP